MSVRLMWLMCGRCGRFHAVAGAEFGGYSYHGAFTSCFHVWNLKSMFQSKPWCNSPKKSIEIRKAGAASMLSGQNIPTSLVSRTLESWLQNVNKGNHPQRALIQVSETLYYLIGALEHFVFSHILGMSSSQLTFIFFGGVAQPPTRHYIIDIP